MSLCRENKLREKFLVNRLMGFLGFPKRGTKEGTRKKNSQAKIFPSSHDVKLLISDFHCHID